MTAINNDISDTFSDLFSLLDHMQPSDDINVILSASDVNSVRENSYGSYNLLTAILQMYEDDLAPGKNKERFEKVIKHRYLEVNKCTSTAMGTLYLMAETCVFSLTLEDLEEHDTRLDFCMYVVKQLLLHPRIRIDSNLLSIFCKLAPFKSEWHETMYRQLFDMVLCHKHCDANCMKGKKHMLWISCLHNNTIAMDQLLLQPLIDVNTILYPLIDMKNYHYMERILARQDIFVNREKSSQRGTALYYAVSQGDAKAVELLLAHSDINVNTGKVKLSIAPLFKASSAGFTHIVELLLAKDGIDVNTTGTRTSGPLHVACGHSHDAVAKLLMEHPAIDVNNAGVAGRTALYFSCYYNSKVCAQLLLRNEKIDVNKVANDGTSPLYVACQKGYYEIAELLLKHADIDKTNLAELIDDLQLRNPCRQLLIKYTA